MFKSKKLGLSSSRKGCMRGKGGPENATCTFKGVRQRTWGKWVAEIRESHNGARLWLGTFDTSYEAAMAYDAAARKIYGDNAKLNLPELAASTGFRSSRGSLPPNKYPRKERDVPVCQNPENESLPQSPFPGVNTGSVICSNNPGSTNEKAEEIKNYDFLENLKVNLPEFDDSAIWEEAVATLDFQAMFDRGMFASDLDEANWDLVKFPWSTKRMLM